VFLLSGRNLDEWKEEATEDLRAFARIRGIGVIEAYCRRGLEKTLTECGWQVEQVVMRLKKEKEGAINVRQPVRWQ
jgi:hypothetical protein